MRQEPSRFCRVIVTGFDWPLISGSGLSSLIPRSPNSGPPPPPLSAPSHPTPLFPLFPFFHVFLSPLASAALQTVLKVDPAPFFMGVRARRHTDTRKQRTEPPHTHSTHPRTPSSPTELSHMRGEGGRERKGAEGGGGGSGSLCKRAREIMGAQICGLCGFSLVFVIFFFFFFLSFLFFSSFFSYFFLFLLLLYSCGGLLTTQKPTAPSGPPVPAARRRPQLVQLGEREEPGRGAVRGSERCGAARPWGERSCPTETGGK